MILGTTFFGGKHTLLPPLMNTSSINSISLSDGVYDHLYLSTNPSKTVIDDSWSYDTKLNASYNKDLEAGNIGFSTKNTDTIIIKTRCKGSFDWKTIYTIPIEKDEDFNFTKSYPFSPNMSTNEYMLVGQINGIENSYVITECKTDFDGFFLTDKNNIYGTVFNIDNTNTTQNVNNTVQELLHSKYPSVYTNSDSNYTSGTTSGCFIKFDTETNKADIENGWKYRRDIMQWLCNNRPKILKLEDGRIFMIKIVGKPTDNDDGHRDLRRISFDWVEIGDVDNERALYINNLSDVGEAYWS